MTHIKSKENKEIIIIIGLPGSGKSTLAKKISKNMNYLLYDFDDHIPLFIKNKITKGELISEKDRLNCTKKLIQDLNTISKKTKLFVLVL